MTWRILQINLFPTRMLRTGYNIHAIPDTLIRQLKDEMRSLTIKRLVMCLLGALAPIAPAMPAVPGDEAETRFEDLHARWNDVLDFTERALAAPRLGKREIEPLMQNITVVRESAQETRERAELELAKYTRLLNALGPPPKEGEPPESDDVRAKRSTLGEQTARLDGRIKQSALVLVRAAGILRQIADAELVTLARLLSQRSPPPFSPGVVATAFSQIPGRLQELGGDGIQWWSQQDLTPHLGTRIALALLTIIVVLTFWWVSHQRLLRAHGRDPDIRDPAAHQQLIAALVESTARVLLPVVCILALTFSILHILALGQEFRSLVNRLSIAGLQFVVVTGLSAVVLAPRRRQWRMTNFTNDAAMQLDRALWLFAGVALLVHSVLAVSGVAIVEPLLVKRLTGIRAPAELSAVVGMGALLVLSSLVFNVLRSRNWRFVDASTDPPSESMPSMRYGLLFVLARAGLVISVIAGVFGYLNFGLFVSKRIVWTLALFGIAWLIHGLIGAGAKQATSEGNALGAWVRQRLGLGNAGAARLEFWVVLLADVLLLLVTAISTLLTWGMPWTEVRPIFAGLADGIEVGDFEFSIFNIGIAIIVFVLLSIGVRLVQRLLSNRILVQTSLDIGVRDALTSGVGYVGIVLAVLVTFSVLGLNLSQLTIIFGALSVGIGFGLQHTVNNFVSGLILLIQRPIKSGDWIVIGNQEGYVKRINVISTEIQTFDNASLIVPNSNLVTTEVMNWMHKSKVGRVIIPVGVSYDSNPERVREVLMKCADGNDEVLKRPLPQVIFREFGNSSLDFELRFYIRDIDQRLRTASDLRFAIKKALDEAGIEIPFPQRDVHIRNKPNPAEAVTADRATSSAGQPTGLTRNRNIAGDQAAIGVEKHEPKD